MSVENVDIETVVMAGLCRDRYLLEKAVVGGGA